VASTVVGDPLAPPGRLRTPVAGGASLALRAPLRRPRSAARVIAAFPSALYLRLRSETEPRVVALVSSDAARPPNSIVVSAPARDLPFGAAREGDEAWVGEGLVDIAGPAHAGGSGTSPRIRVKVRRWWDPSPALGPLSPVDIAQGLLVLESETAGAACGLAEHPGPRILAERCAEGDLAYAVDAAERIVGLGPGLTPSGDDVLAGLLLSLRVFGTSLPCGETAIWLADWLGAAVTAHADTRTTPLAATLLHCAALGQAGTELAAVLHGMAGRCPLQPAVRRLLGVGHTSGADLAWGVLAGCRAALALEATAVARPGKALA
jgi:hypothetical protein